MLRYATGSPGSVLPAVKHVQSSDPSIIVLAVNKNASERAFSGVYVSCTSDSDFHVSGAIILANEEFIHGSVSDLVLRY
jgi:hypothetical protein